MVMHQLVPDVLRWMTDRVLRRADRPWTGVGKAVNESEIYVVEEKPVAPQGFPEPANEPLGEDHGQEASQRSSAVAIVEEPRTQPGGLKLRFRRRAHNLFSFNSSAW